LVAFNATLSCHDFFPLSSLWHCLLPIILFPTLCVCAPHKQNVWMPLYLEINMTHLCMFSLVKTCVVGYSIHVIPCFSLTPTAIDYREPNILATMQQPSSVVHNMLQYTQSLNTQNTGKSRCSVQCFGRKLLHSWTSGVRVGMCNQPVIHLGEVSTLPNQRVELIPDVPCLQCTLWMQVWVVIDSNPWHIKSQPHPLNQECGNLSPAYDRLIAHADPNTRSA